jgi:hypothetical protein
MAGLIEEAGRLSAEMVRIWCVDDYNNRQIMEIYMDERNDCLLGLHQLIEREWYYENFRIVDPLRG